MPAPRRSGHGTLLRRWTFPPEHFVSPVRVPAKRGDTFWELPLELAKQWPGLLIDAAVEEPCVRVVGQECADHVRSPPTALEFVRNADSLELD